MKVKGLLDALHPTKLLPSLTAGLIAAITVVSVEISLAALVFSGALSPFVAAGVGFFLFGSFALLLVSAITSTVPGAISVPQDTPAAVLALVAAGIASRMAPAASPDELFATVVAAIALTSLGAGAVFLLFGRLKLSGFTRFVPYPVIGGFLAGTGWLLARGAFSVMADSAPTLANLPVFFRTDILVHWLPGLVFAVVLLLILRHYSHFLVIPGMLVLAIGLFYLGLGVSGTSVAEAAAKGWLMGPFDQQALFRPPGIASLSAVDWSVIASQLDKIGVVIVLSLISLLLNASGLEIATRKDIDLNRELQSSGLANLLAGPFGSPVGYQALSLTMLTHRLKAQSRLTGVIAALVCAGALFYGASALAYFPKPVLGGILLFLGLSFLVEWVIDAKVRLPRVEYLLVLLILVSIASIGFLEGIAVGVLAAVVMFVVSYSRINAVKNTLSGDNYHSKVERPLAHRQRLKERGGEIFILRLQGFIFFGTAQNLLDRIKARLEDPQQPVLRFVILDFRQVVLLDSSAVFSITRMKQLSESHRILMVWTNVSAAIVRLLEKGGLVDETDEAFLILPTLDHGLEWCENRILAEDGETDLTGFIEKIERHLKQAIHELKDARRVVRHLEKRQLQKGEYLIRQGDHPDEMYFIEAGLLSAQLELPDGKLLRLRSMRGGTTVGEIGMYLGNQRTASVVADRPSVVYRLSVEALKEMEARDPGAAALLHKWIARLLAERLAENNRTLEALLD